MPRAGVPQTLALHGVTARDAVRCRSRQAKAASQICVSAA